MTRQYKIAMLAACPFPYPRGTPIRIHRMAESLASRGHDVHVISYHLGNDPGPVDFTIHRIANVPTYHKCTPGPTYQKLAVLDPLLCLKLRRVTGSRPFDLIHAHHYEGLLAALGGRRGLPIIFDAHTLLQSELPSYGLGLMHRTKKWIGRTIDRHLPKRANHVISVTEDIRTRLIDDHGLEANRITVIPNGVECDHFDRGSSPTNGKSNGRTVVFTGNLASYQRIDLLLGAFKILSELRPGVTLLMVTDDPFDPYESMARKFGIRDRIELVKSDFDSLPGHLARGDVALNPRVECDGLPQKLLNYMAARKPIVSFVSSGKDVTDGITGLVVEDGDTNAFALAVDQLLEDRTMARRMGENAGAFVRAELSWEHTARRTEAVYRQLLEPAAMASRGGDELASCRGGAS